MNSQLQLQGPGEKLQVVQVEKPVPEAGEVIIKLKVVALNPVDWKRRETGSMNNVTTSWPLVLGFEGSGVIDAVGEGVTRFSVGDEVLTSCGGRESLAKQGAFQQYTTVAESNVAKKPSSMSFEDAAGIQICFWTAAAAIHMGLGVPLPWTSATSNGQTDELKTILVLGGSSVVGAFAIRQLRLLLPSSTTKILTTCSPQNHALAQSLGADAAFDSNSPTLITDIRAASTSGTGASAILDAVSAAALRHDVLDVLDPAGPRIFTEVPSSANMATEDIPKDIVASKIGMFALLMKMGKAGGMGPLQEVLGGLLERKEIEMPVRVEVVGHRLEAVEAGLKRLKAGVSACKLVVTM